MLDKNTIIGISDITSSEGKLKRFTKICRLIEAEKRATRKKIEVLLQKKIGSPFHNKKVIQRHLVILKKINLIENMGGIYMLSSEGKALCALVKDSNKSSGLSFEEKVFYFKTLFTSILSRQLIKFLEVIYEHRNEERKKIIGYFFQTELARNLWNRKVIEKNLLRLEEGRVPTFFQNKFGCMEMWLRDLELIKSQKRKIILRKSAIIFLKKISNSQNLKDNIYELIGTALSYRTTPFNFKMHKNIFIKIFKDAYFLFKTESNLSDIRSIKNFVCVKLFKDQIRIEERKFDSILEELWKEGIIRSVMLGRDGKSSYVSLSETI